MGKPRLEIAFQTGMALLLWVLIAYVRSAKLASLDIGEALGKVKENANGSGFLAWGSYNLTEQTNGCKAGEIVQDK